MGGATAPSPTTPIPPHDGITDRRWDPPALSRRHHRLPVRQSNDPHRTLTQQLVEGVRADPRPECELGPRLPASPIGHLQIHEHRDRRTVGRHLTHTQLLQSKSLTVGHGAGVSPHLLRPLTKSLRNQLARSPRDPAPDVPPRLIQRRLHQKERIPMRPPLPETTDTAVPPHQPLRAGQVVPAQPLPPHPLQPGRSHPRNQHRPPRAALPRLQTPRRRRQIPQRPRKPQQLRRLLRRQIQPPRHPLPQTPAPIPSGTCRRSASATNTACRATA